MKQHPLLPRPDGRWFRMIHPKGEVSMRVVMLKGNCKGALYQFHSATLVQDRPGWLRAEYRVVGHNPLKKERTRGR